MSFQSIADITAYNEIVASNDAIKSLHETRMSVVTETMKTEITAWVEKQIEKIQKEATEEKKCNGSIEVPDAWNLYSIIMKDMINIRFPNDVFMVSVVSSDPPKYKIDYIVNQINVDSVHSLKMLLATQLHIKLYNEKIEALKTYIIAQDMHIRTTTSLFNTNFDKYNEIAISLAKTVIDGNYGDGVITFMRAEYLELNLLTTIVQDKLRNYTCTIVPTVEPLHYELTYKIRR